MKIKIFNKTKKKDVELNIELAGVCSITGELYFSVQYEDGSMMSITHAMALDYINNRI